MNRKKKRKKSKSIVVSISVLFIFINIICFIVIFYLIEDQYYQMAKKNIYESNVKAAESFQRDFENIRFYMNDLTLRIYADEDINLLCRKIYQGDYKSEQEKQLLVAQAQDACFEYLYYYDFVQSIRIFMEDDAKTDIRLMRGNWISTVTDCRDEVQEEIIACKGVLKCYDVGAEHQIIFARTLKDFQNVLKDDRVMGTVMLNLSPKYLQDSLSDIGITENSYAMLKSEDGTISSSTRKGNKGRSFQDVLDEEEAQQSMEVFTMKIKPLRQELVILTPSSDIRLSVGAFSKTLILVIALMALLNFIIVLAVSRMLTKPVGKLVSQIQGIGVDSIVNQHVEASGYREIEDIADNFNYMLNRIEVLVKENYLITLKEKNARIEAMQSQINPHFIFNTLETINWKVMFLDVPEVSNMISYLGNILRYTTYQYGKYVSVKQEMAQIENYLYIQEIRYDHSFDTRILMDEDAGKTIIPCLLIQPLVENAVVHGLRNKKDGVLMIRARIRKDNLEITVLDNGCGMDASIIQNILKKPDEMIGESIGLANVNQRLCLTYNLEQGLYIKSRKGHYTRMDIVIPLTQGEGQEENSDD